MASIATSRSLSAEEHSLLIDTDLRAVKCILRFLWMKTVRTHVKTSSINYTSQRHPLPFGFILALFGVFTDLRPISHNQAAPDQRHSIELSRRLNAFFFFFFFPDDQLSCTAQCDTDRLCPLTPREHCADAVLGRQQA